VVSRIRRRQSTYVGGIDPDGPDAMFRTLKLRRQSAVARPGDIIEHPITRERLTFLETSAETGGACVRYQLEVAPGGFVAAPHVHPWIEERIDIVSGEWIFVIEGVERLLSPGDSAIIPARQAHSWRNAGPETGVAIVECRPALKTEEFFETFFGLAQDGLVDPTSGLPFQPWLAMMVVDYHNDFAHPAEPPLQVIIDSMRPIADEARRQGLRFPYPYPHPDRSSESVRGPGSVA
jgi:quercetin dioxygenase-like cupin family protein